MGQDEAKKMWVGSALEDWEVSESLLASGKYNHALFFVQDLVGQYLDGLRQQGLNIDQSYIFGSYAKGKVWEGSDIDVCVVSPQFSADYEKWKSVSNRLAIKIDSRIEPVLMSVEEFTNKYDPLVAEIKQYGMAVN